MKMTLLIGGISLPYTAPASEALRRARRILNGVHLLSRETALSVYRRSVDARRRQDIRFVYTVAATDDFSPSAVAAHKNKFSVLKAESPRPTYGTLPLSARPVVVGSGPCGLFCALLLAENGYRPILLERGGTVEERKHAAYALRTERRLDTNTNIQFGAGGAGTFSDGKLVTRINDPLCGYVLDTFVEMGAPKEITLLAKPHVGTDILSVIVTRMLARISELGGEVRYHTALTDLVISSGKVIGIKTTEGELACGALVLAVGHSARDTYRMLLSRGLSVEPKPFSVGLRIEHLQADIDRALYGAAAGDPLLGAAEYHLSHNTHERGVYTFCMCPGGEVVAATSEDGGVVVNGMSNHGRDGKNANSAVVCSVFCEDYGATPEGAIAFQRRIEQAAYCAGGNDFSAPCVTVGDFLSSRVGTEPARVLPTYMNGEGVRLASPDAYLPSFVCEGIRAALPAFGRQIEGFAAADALLTGAETRTSAPVRLLRTEDGRALGYENLYPAGEGAGYAGGITSAAVDGIRAALSLMAKYSAE